VSVGVGTPESGERGDGHDGVAEPVGGADENLHIIHLSMLSSEQLAALDRDGFLVLPGLLSEGMLEALRKRVEELFEEEGERAGGEFKRTSRCMWT